MRFWKWVVFLGVLGFAGYVIVNDMKERVHAAEAMAWYRNSQVMEHRHYDIKEWKAFKECVAIGDTVQDCMNQLD